jgi:hypothetical protein
MVFFTALLCGRFFGVRFIRHRRLLRAGCVGGLLLSSILAVWVGRTRLLSTASDPMPALRPSRHFYQMALLTEVISRRVDPLPVELYFAMKSNTGSISAFSSLVFERRAIPKYAVTRSGVARFCSNYPGEVFCLRPENRVRIVERTGNRVRVECDLVTPDVVVVNQNAHPSWRAGRLRIVEHEGLLAAEIQQAGHRTVEFRFEPWDLHAGLAVTLATVLLGAFWAAYRRQRCRADVEVPPQEGVLQESA